MKRKNRNLVGGAALLSAILALNTSAIAKADGSKPKPKPPTQTVAGTNTGGSDAAMNFTIEWCHGAIAILEEAQRRELNQEVRGNKPQALKVLIDGLDKALADEQNANSEDTLTFRMLDRGKKLAQAVQDTTLDDVDGLDTSINAMKMYYTFVEQMSRELDVVYYVPAHYAHHGCKSCGTVDMDQFEEKYEQYAKAQLVWVAGARNPYTKMISGNFTDSITAKDGSGMEIHPKGSAKALLKMEELTTQNVTEDLVDSIFNARYACVVKSMVILNGDLANHNGGDMGIYGDDRYAINETIPALVDASERIHGGCGK